MGDSFVGYLDNANVNTTTGTDNINFQTADVAAVPEPATWAMMLVGFGLVGAGMRRQRSTLVAA